MDMDDQTGMADLRQYMNRRPFFPPIPPATDLLSGHPGLTQAQPYDMFMIPHGLQPTFRSDSTTSNTTGGGGGGSSSSAGGAGGFGGFEMEAGGLNSGGDGGTGRWPRQETLTLLEIRSRLDPKFKEANQKGPLWDEVSRIMSEEHGYQRSGKKCREKFENLYKYYKKTKEGKAGRQDGKHYRFFRQLEALYGEQEAYQAPKLSDTSLSISNSSDFDTTSSDGGDVNGGINDNSSGDIQKKRGKRRWKAKIKDFIDAQMRKLMDKQEDWMEKMMRTIEDKEQERMIREEEWRKQDADRIEKEHKFWTNERAWIEARYAALMEAIRNVTGKELKASPSDELMAVETRSLIENQNDDEKGEIWPECEITRLIQLRTNMDSRFQQGGISEEVLWEGIATKMACFGYDRSALVCKEKWDNVNNYVLKCNKKRKENPKSCYYHYQNNESICNNHGGAFCDNTSGLRPEASPSDSNTANVMNDSCFRYFMGDDHNMWDNYGLKLNKLG
ncbi:Trihelix transcription factor PTL [Abeliophyllum distichum]|uniref:Trihelix transcription factor PTL n=1 Tax=Abeliophyllum distichum TaxID=126358 RepID=A0ABD1V8B1_9LAMI